MKPITWKIALAFGIAFSLSVFTESDQNTANAVSLAQRGKGGGEGRSGNGGSRAGGGVQSGRGSGGARTGGGIQSGRGGGESRSGGQIQSGRSGGGRPTGGGFRGAGGIHAPSRTSPRNPGGALQMPRGGDAGRGGLNPGNVRTPSPNRPPVTNRTPSVNRPSSPNRTPSLNRPSSITRTPSLDRRPSLSHPNPGSIRSGITRNPIINRGGNNTQGNRPRVGGIDGRQINRGIPGIDGRNNLRSGRPSIDNLNRSGIVNRNYNGNSFRLNNRQIPLANNHYRPSWHRHSNYYHGSWNGNRGFGSGIGFGLGTRLGYGIGSNRGDGWGLGSGYGYGGYGRDYWYGGRPRFGRYGYRPLGWGLGGWGLGTLVYNSGYLGYSNPYYTTGGWSGYNYSQPIQVTYTRPVTVIENSEPTSSGSVLDDAVAAFRQNDYDAALDITNKGITQTPDDAVLHEFRALVLFAKQDYQQAASTIHSVLAVGPGWDWTTMSGMYADVSLYTTHLRALEAFTKSNPQDAATRFLLAYHYLSCGHADAALRQLEHVVKLMPNDRVAADILQMLQPPPADESASADNPQQPAPETELPVLAPLDPQTLVGNWKASRQDGSAFTLSMTDDSKFTWSFALKDQPAQEFGGTYAVEDNILALERSDGGSLIAEVTPNGSDRFNFRMVGAPEDDAGLDFSK